MLIPSLQSGGVDSSTKGLYSPLPVKGMAYGRGCIKSLPEVISKLGASKAFIITGSSLREKTPVIKDIEGILGTLHAGTYSGVRQHAPIADIKIAMSMISESGADVLISVGGGSPIDSAKAASYNLHEQTGVWIPSIAVPTTLSVAETTQNAGFTNEEGHKVAVFNAELAPKVVLYDADITFYTPMRLWLSSGLRAIDHAVELQYHPAAPEVPTKRLARDSLRELFALLPACHKDPNDADVRQKLLLAAYAALFPIEFSGGIGLSHSLGHALGATYAIPHGITSCISLAATVHFKAERSTEEAEQIAAILPYLGKPPSGDVVKDAHVVGNAIEELVGALGLRTSLADYDVQRGEEGAIASRALRGNTSHPDFQAITEMVRKLY